MQFVAIMVVAGTGAFIVPVISSYINGEAIPVKIVLNNMDIFLFLQSCYF